MAGGSLPGLTKGVLEFLGGAWAFVFFKSDTHGLPKWTAIDLTLGLKWFFYFLITVVRLNKVSF